MGNSLGNNIKKARLASNYSIDKLSKEAGIGSSTISQIESGKRRSLRSETINKIAKALNVNTGMLLNSEDEQINDLITLINLLIINEDLSIDGIKLDDCEKAELKNALLIFTNHIKYKRLYR